jgi:ferric-dicitrate binding protein FerR (iron transport regulator)
VAVRQVPSCAPDNRAQYREWNKLWPMPWRAPSGKTTEQQDGEAPSAADQRYFEQHMAGVLAAAAAAGSRNVARIVDPATGVAL